MSSTFVAFDAATLISQGRRTLAVPFAFVVLVAFLSPISSLAVLTGAVMVSLLASTPFATDERGRLDTLYGVAPVSRSAVVIGRYLTLLLLYAAVAVVANLAAVLAPMVLGRAVRLELLAPMNLIAVVVVIVALSVQLPFFFRLGYTRARPMMFLPVLVVAGVAWLAEQLGLLDPVTARIAALDPAQLVLGAVGAVGVAALLLVGSVVGSCRLYRSRQL